jgi:histidine triad (HIT) family protein
MSFAIPVKRLRETNHLLAFWHPKPEHRFHVLIVPKKAIRGLSELSAEDQDFLFDCFQCVRSLVEEYKLAEIGYRLISNGGAYQDVKQLHFHLVAGEPLP